MNKVETSAITRLKVSILYVESPPPVDKVVTFSLIKTREPTTFHLLGLDFTHFKYMFWTNFEFILSFTIFWLLGSTWIKMTGPQGNQTNQHTKSPYLREKKKGHWSNSETFDSFFNMKDDSYRWMWNTCELTTVCNGTCYYW